MYENRDNLKLLPIEFFVDGQVKQDVIGEIENVKTYQKLEQLPPRTIKISKCKYCHYKISVHAYSLSLNLITNPRSNCARSL